MDHVFIYGLVDPRDDVVRYIGKADDLHRRLQDHLSEAARGVETPKNRWVRKLAVVGVEPRIRVLAVVPRLMWQHAERSFIAHYRGLNVRLLNGTAGGDGGAITDPQALARIRAAHLGVKRSPEIRRRMSEAHRRRWEDADELRQRYSESGRARGVRPPRKVGSEQATAKLTEASVLEIREAHAAGASCAELARQYGVTKTLISYAVTGRTWKHVGGPIREAAPVRRLTDDDVAEILRRVAAGETQTAVAAAFGVHQSRVCQLARKSRR